MQILAKFSRIGITGRAGEFTQLSRRLEKEIRKQAQTEGWHTGHLSQKPARARTRLLGTPAPVAKPCPWLLLQPTRPSRANALTSVQLLSLEPSQCHRFYTIPSPQISP